MSGCKPDVHIVAMRALFAQDKEARAAERAQDKRDTRNAVYQAVMLAVAILAGVFYIIRILNT